MKLSRWISKFIEVVTYVYVNQGPIVLRKKITSVGQERFKMFCRVMRYLEHQRYLAIVCCIVYIHTIIYILYIHNITNKK